MKIENLSEELNRTVKIAIDNGEALTVEHAKKMFKSYKIGIEVGKKVISSPTLQAAVLTAVNTARRCFLGGVFISGKVNVPLLVPWRKFNLLSEAIIDLCGEIVDKLPESMPRLFAGENITSFEEGTIALRLTFNGWCGGVVPTEDNFRLPEDQEFIPSGILAGALGVSEVFQHIRGDNQLACHRIVGLSLWNPSSNNGWFLPENYGPLVQKLPSKVWVLGLGHLGQAFLWTLGLLPYANPIDVQLVLQDFDILNRANESTSLLTFSDSLKKKKTRAMGDWCEERGFNSILNERRFESNFKTSDSEPCVAICAFDNAPSRAILEDIGFTRIIEAGLGKEGNEYLSFTLHTFPGPQKAKNLWKNKVAVIESTSENAPAYKDLHDRGLDECGITTLAGRTVGASFVGTLVSTLMVAELLKIINGGQSCAVIDGTLRTLDSLEAIENTCWNEPLNPGVTTPC